MADPSTPDGGDTIAPLPRRAAAAAVDLAAVLLPSFLFLRTAAERFPVETLIDGTKRFSDEDRVRVEEIGQGFNRTLELDGVLYTLSGIGLWIVLVCSAAIAALVYVVVPDRNGGRTPGKQIFGLWTVDEDGRPASIGAHAVRTVVGVADLVPFVIPGALGTYLAATDELGRRLGDRVARTLVVSEGDETDGEWFTYRGTMVGRGEDGPGDDAVDLGSRLSSTTAPASIATIVRPSIKPADDPADSADPDDGLDQHPEGEPDLDEWWTLDDGPTPDGFISAETSHETETATDTATDTATEEPVALLDPDPMERPGLDNSLEPPEPATDATDDTHEDPSDADLGDADLGDADLGTGDLSAETPSSDDVTPTDPSGEGVDEAGFEADTSSVEGAVDPGPEPEDGPEPAVATDGAAEADPEPATGPEPATSPEPSASSKTTEPEWNEAWKAWMYWDRESKRWFRHDEASGKWTPLP